MSACQEQIYFPTPLQLSKMSLLSALSLDFADSSTVFLQVLEEHICDSSSRRAMSMASRNFCTAWQAGCVCIAWQTYLLRRCQ